MAEHLITPPPELVSEWARNRGYSCSSELWDYIATQAARWGADTELEACCLLLDSGEHAATYGCHDGTSLRAARRPTPPSLKEQALHILDTHGPLTPAEADTIRRALEALPE